MTQVTGEITLHTSEEWLELLYPNHEIKDHDGWRTADSPHFFNDPITEEDFQRRFNISTVGPRHNLPPRLRVVAGGPAPEWGPDAARLNLAFAKVRDAFGSLSSTREEFVAARDAYRAQRREYERKWADTPEAIAYFEDRTVAAPDGWDE